MIRTPLSMSAGWRWPRDSGPRHRDNCCAPASRCSARPPLPVRWPRPPGNADWSTAGCRRRARRSCGSTGTPHRMTQQDGYRLIERYAKRAGIKTRIGNHSLRATGITDYLKSDGSLSEARKMANHADTRTTQLYDRRADVASLDEYGKVGI